MELYVPNENQPEGDQTPFVIENLRHDVEADGSFRPVAAIRLTPALRTSGLLRALPGDDIRNLLLMLTFLHPNGWCQPTVFELADAMRTSQDNSRAMMGRLTAFKWNGKPLVTELRRDNGMDGFAPAPHIIGQEVIAAEDAAASGPPIQAAGRDAVVAYSREHYARPREEVEREMAIRNGWPLPEELAPTQEADGTLAEEDPGCAEARLRLAGLHVPKEEINRLLLNYDIERVMRQVRWLPNRNAKNKARFVVAAIDGNYEEPASLRTY